MSVTSARPHYFTERPQPVQFTRSRPYHKNDNAHMEQKNWTHVCCLLGYGRLEKRTLVERINRLYRGPWQRFHNHFCPSVKLLEKRREGARIIKRHDKPKTPYQRFAGKRDAGCGSTSPTDARARATQPLRTPAADRRRAATNPRIPLPARPRGGLRSRCLSATLRGTFRSIAHAEDCARIDTQSSVSLRCHEL